MKKIKVYNTEYLSLGVTLMTPYEEEYHEKTNCLHIHFFKWSIWITLPQILKPEMKYVDLSNESWATTNKDGKKGYWESIRKEYGISFNEEAVHIQYGIQPGCWYSKDPKNSDHTKVIFYPWNYDHYRTEVFSLDFKQSWDDTNIKLGAKETEWGAIQNLQYIFKDKEKSWNCYVDFPHIFKYATYIDKYDNTEIKARYHIIEREWRRFKLPFLKMIRRTIDIDFKDEVGSRKGSWKGGIIGMGFEMRENETHEQTWERFCREGKV